MVDIFTMAILQKTALEIKCIKEAGLILAQIMKELSKKVVPGVSTAQLDKFAEELIKEYKCKSAFKGYRGYPANICTSINNEVVHGIPSSERMLKEGDIAGIDIGIEYKGFYSDTAVTFAVGKISNSAVRLINTTKEALDVGIEMAVAGNRLGDISSAIQSYVEKKGYSVVKRFVGHGIGKALHEEPEIPNFGISGEGPVLRNGMVFAIEPMVNEGKDEVEILNDGWTAVTKDRKLSSHFEHTVLISGEKAQILTDF